MGTQPALWYINVYKCQSRSVKMISILPWEPRFFSCNHSQVHPTMKISKQAWTLELDIVGETSGERRSRLGNHRHYNRHTYSILFQSLFQSSCVYIHHNIYIYIYRYTFYNTTTAISWWKITWEIPRSAEAMAVMVSCVEDTFERISAEDRAGITGRP